MSQATSSPQASVKHSSVWKKRPEWWRWVLSLYFACYTYIVAQGMFPLPDEPNRIKFLPLALTALGAVMALQVLVNHTRLFYFGLLSFLLFSYFKMDDRIRFLEMMLEPNHWEIWLRYSHALGLLLINPWVWRSFADKTIFEGGEKPVLLKKGIPF